MSLTIKFLLKDRKDRVPIEALFLLLFSFIIYRSIVFFCYKFPSPRFGLLSPSHAALSRASQGRAKRDQERHKEPRKNGFLFLP